MTAIPMVSQWVHYGVILNLPPFHAGSTAVDMGGANGRLSTLLPGISVTEVNPVYGTSTKGLANKSFDFAVSIATLEHVKNQEHFLNESIRLARHAIVHWFPYGQAADDAGQFAAKLGHSHPCTLPDKSCFPKGCKVETHMTVGEYLLLLASIKPALACPELFEYVKEHGHKRYGVVLFYSTGEE